MKIFSPYYLAGLKNDFDKKGSKMNKNSQNRWANLQKGVLAIIISCSFFSLLLIGCASQSSSGKTSKPVLDDVKSLPNGVGVKLFSVISKKESHGLLDRLQKKYNIAFTEGVPLFTNDKIENTSGDVIEIQEANDNFKVGIKPNAKIEFFPDSIFLNEGSAQFKFRKIKGGYQIRLPGSMVGVRGTIFDVEVKKDKSSTIFLREGKIQITCGSEVSELNEGEVALIGPEGASIKVFPKGSELPDFLKNSTEEGAKGALH